MRKIILALMVVVFFMSCSNENQENNEVGRYQFCYKDHLGYNTVLDTKTGKLITICDDFYVNIRDFTKGTVKRSEVIMEK